MSKKPTKINEAMANAFGRVRLYEQAFEDLMQVLNLVRTDQPDYASKAISDAGAVLSRSLHEKQNQAYKDLLLWAHLNNSPEAQKGAELACQRYLGERIAIMDHLDSMGMSPQSYLSSDKEDFRKEITEAIKEKFHGHKFK
jgi:hypothetical protein